MKRARINLSDSAHAYVRKLKEEHPELTSDTNVIEKIIQEHKSFEAGDLIKKIENILTGIRLSSRTAEKNSWIFFEMLNQYFLSKNEVQLHHKFIPSDQIKSVITIGAEKHVSDKMQKYRTAKKEGLASYKKY